MIPYRKSAGAIFYQPLTCIRQTGTLRASNGSVTYTFVAQVSRALPPVMITMMCTERGEVQVTGHFEEALRAALPEDVRESGKGA